MLGVYSAVDADPARLQLVMHPLIDLADRPHRVSRLLWRERGNMIPSIKAIWSGSGCWGVSFGLADLENGQKQFARAAAAQEHQGFSSSSVNFYVSL